MMKSVDVIQEVQVLPGQRLATSPVANPAGWRKRKSGAGQGKLPGSVWSLEKMSKVVVPIGISEGGDA